MGAFDPRHLTSGFLQSTKHADVIPVLKTRDYDVNVLSNYRPISNISFLAKTAERFVARQLQHFLDENGIYGVYQSAYRPRHSAETALLRIHNDVAQSIDARRGVLLVLLDLSADTLDKAVLLRRLHGYGMCGDTHAWLASYLQGRTSMVRVKKDISESSVIRTGVPQGSVLGPILFNVHIAPLAKLLQQPGIQHPLYADDKQFYGDFPPTKHADALARMEACVRDVNIWLCDNGLILNGTKSQATVISSPASARQ